MIASQIILSQYFPGMRMCDVWCCVKNNLSACRKLWERFRVTVYCEHCQENQLSFSIHHHWDTWQRSRFLDVRRGRIVLYASASRLSIWQYIHNWIFDEPCEPDICDINKYGTTERDDHENNHSHFVINITAFRDADCQNVNKYDKNEVFFYYYLFSIQTFREVNL